MMTHDHGDYTMDAVLPLTSRDLKRFGVLQRSLSQNLTGLGTCWVVVPDGQMAEIEDSVTHPGFRLVKESEIVPEFRHYPLIRGWVRQQLIKMAIADRIESDFYLTFDADVICAKKVSTNRLLKDGKALSYCLDEDIAPGWYQGSARVLGMAPVRSGILHAVTPSVLSKAAMLHLHDFLNRRFHDWPLPCNRTNLRWLIAKFRVACGGWKDDAPWRLLLLCIQGWTEYALYFTYLEATGVFERYHTWSDDCIYSIDDSVWHPEQLGTWNPARFFESAGAPYFLVIQSTTNADNEAVWARLQELSPATGPGAPAAPCQAGPSAESCRSHETAPTPSPT